MSVLFGKSTAWILGKTPPWMMVTPLSSLLSSLSLRIASCRRRRMILDFLLSRAALPVNSSTSATRYSMTVTTSPTKLHRRRCRRYRRHNAAHCLGCLAITKLTPVKGIIDKEFWSCNEKLIILKNLIWLLFLKQFLANSHRQTFITNIPLRKKQSRSPNNMKLLCSWFSAILTNLLYTICIWSFLYTKCIQWLYTICI